MRDLAHSCSNYIILLVYIVYYWLSDSLLLSDNFESPIKSRIAILIVYGCIFSSAFFLQIATKMAYKFSSIFTVLLMFIVV